QGDPAAVVQRRNAPSRYINLPPIDIHHHDTRFTTGLTEDLTPRGHRKTRAVCFAPALMQPTLGRCQNEASRLDCPRPQKYVPMRFARDPGKCRWDADEVCTRQCQGFVNSREAHVI